PIAADSAHIRTMARSPEKKSAPAERAERRQTVRGTRAPEPMQGFAEAPQAAFEGAPLTGPVSGWAEQVAREAEHEARQPRRSRKIPERSSAPTKTARGTSMGGAASPRERAAAGLNPVAGLDIALEDVGTLTASGVTATVAALSKLI